MVKSQSTHQFDRLAYSVNELAAALGISRATLYSLWREGRGPIRMRVRGRVLVSREAAESWRALVEAESVR